MRNLKLFTKIFLYTFGVMLFVTVMAHVFLYVLAPQMTVSTNRFVEGAIIESDVNTGILIKSASVHQRRGHPLEAPVQPGRATGPLFRQG